MDTNHQPVELTLDQCIKCNICTTACPVSAATDLFPGPKFDAPQAGRFRQPDQPTPDQSVDYCSGCRACNMACPTGVKIAEMNARARATLVKQGKLPPMKRLRNNMVARAELLGKLAQPVAPLANAALSFPPARLATDKVFGIARQAPFPPFARQRFTTWFNKHPHPSETSRQVVYFHGCSTQYYEPRVGRAAVHVLEANGFDLIVPPQNCCGLPLLSNEDQLNLDLRPIPLSLPYHVPCQYRAHRLGKPGIEMLSLVPELQVSDSHAKRNLPLANHPCHRCACHSSVELLAAAYGYEAEEALAAVLAKTGI